MTAPTGRPAGLPPEDEAQFLRNLVKSSRQRPHLVKWTDRDGAERHTVLTQAEVVRLNAIAAAPNREG